MFIPLPVLLLFYWVKIPPYRCPTPPLSTIILTLFCWRFGCTSFSLPQIGVNPYILSKQVLNVWLHWTGEKVSHCSLRGWAKTVVQKGAETDRNWNKLYIDNIKGFFFWQVWTLHVFALVQGQLHPFGTRDKRLQEVSTYKQVFIPVVLSISTM